MGGNSLLGVLRAFVEVPFFQDKTTEEISFSNKKGALIVATNPCYIEIRMGGGGVQGEYAITP